jgi:hypothetical protein
MKPCKIIIHTNNFDISSHDFWRVQAGIKEYYRLRPNCDNKRLTIRFNPQGEMLIYHNPKAVTDLIICKEVSMEAK